MELKPPQPPMPEGSGSKGVLLAIAIILLWLSGLAFFIAFEGSKVLNEASNPDGKSFFRGLIDGLAQKTVDQELRTLPATGAPAVSA